MRRRFSKLAFIVSVVCVISVSAGAKQTLDSRIRSIINRKSQGKTTFGIKIIKAKSKKAVYSHNANKPLIPASNQKAVISAAAVKILGSDFDFETKIAVDANTLFVIGSGDPLLGDKITDAKYGRARGWIFDDIIATLKKNKVERIDKIVIDATVFDSEYFNPSWPRAQLNQWYAAEVAGINYNGNCVEFTAKASGGKVVPRMYPDTEYVKVINKAKVSSKKRQALGGSRGDKSNTITFYGRCYELKNPIRVTVHNPAMFFGFILGEKLQSAGLSSAVQLAEGKVEDGFSVLKTYKTPIADVLNRCNKDSLQVAAEALLKKMAAKANGNQNGSWQLGAEVMAKYFKKLKIGAEQFEIDDASGLSRKNRLSAGAITTVLADVYKSKSWEIYKNSLAIGGVDGTARKWFRDAKYKGKVFGKSGYIRGVRSFSGVCSTESGDYIFSILTNGGNGKTRAAINDIVEAVVDFYN